MRCRHKGIGYQIKRLKLLLKSNSFWLIICWMLFEGSQVLDPGWVATMPYLKTWLPVIICISGIWYKIFTNMKKDPDYYDFVPNEFEDKYKDKHHDTPNKE